MRRATAGPCRNRTFDWPTLIANKDSEIARLEAAYTDDLEKAGVTIVKSRAVLADPHTRAARRRRARARGHILIATGGAPTYGDPIPGIEHAISSNEAFHLAEAAAAHRSSRAAAISRWSSPGSLPASARR